MPVLLTLAGMHLLTAMLPGPNTVVVSWTSATSSRVDGLKAASGVAVASLLWVSLSIAGFGTILLDAGWLYNSLRVLGAAYLMYVGARMIRPGFRRGGIVPNQRQPGFARRSPFAAGLITTLSNPKSAIFWTSAFLVAVPSHAPSWIYAAILIIVAVQSLGWYGAIALVFSTGRARQTYIRMARWLDLLAGMAMLMLGAKLAYETCREIAKKLAA